jgi:hypothetical protein
MLNEARRHDGVTYMSGDALALPLAHRSRDGLYATPDYTGEMSVEAIYSNLLNTAAPARR